MNWRWMMTGIGTVVATTGLAISMPGLAGDREVVEATPTCADSEALVWVPTGEVDPARTRVCQA